MPRSHVQGLAEESDMPELPRIVDRGGVEQDGVSSGSTVGRTSGESLLRCFPGKRS